MRSSHAVAIWLFERLGLDVALTGDLLEECQRGRSAIWYWRQASAGRRMDRHLGRYPRP